MKCISCGYNHTENFCPNCGERNGIEKITISSIFESTLSTITNMDKGFLFNLKNMFLVPKKITTDYVNGKRKGVLNPISYLIFATTLYIIVITIFKVPVESVSINSYEKSRIGKAGYEAGKFIREYIKYFWIFSVIPLGLSLKIIFRKYNFPENLAISSFIIAQATIIGIASFLLLKIPLIFDPFVFGSMFFLIFKIFKEENDTIASGLLTLTALFLFIIQWVLIIVSIFIIKP